jgi:hypothetical protein
MSLRMNRVSLITPAFRNAKTNRLSLPSPMRRRDCPFATRRLLTSPVTDCF